METLDIILFGGAALFVAVVFLLFSGKTEEEKVNQRLQKLKMARAEESDNKTLTLARRQDKSLGAFGVGGVAERISGRLQMANLQCTVLQYLMICMGIACGTLFLISLVLGKSILLGGMIAFLSGMGLPHAYIGLRIGKRKKQFLQLFPDAIELIVRGLRAGLPVAASMQTVSVEIPDPVGPVFAEMCDQLALGMTLEKAMSGTAHKLNLTEFNFFVISIILQRETGGNLGEVLSNLAEVLRQRHIMKLKIKALSSEARASAIIVGMLPFLVLLALSVTSPDYLKPIMEDIRGNIAAFCAAGSLGAGIFIMTRMARFEI